MLCIIFILIIGVISKLFKFFIPQGKLGSLTV